MLYGWFLGFVPVLWTPLQLRQRPAQSARPTEVDAGWPRVPQFSARRHAYLYNIANCFGLGVRRAETDRACGLVHSTHAAQDDCGWNRPNSAARIVLSPACSGLRRLPQTMICFNLNLLLELIKEKY